MTLYHKIKAGVIRLLMALIRRVRPVPTLPNAPWAPIDAFAHGLVWIRGRWYDLALEVPFRSYREWSDTWTAYIANCLFAHADAGKGDGK